MDKKYLGLGVIFKAIDKGFAKSTKKVQGSLSETNDQLNKIQDSIDGFNLKEFTNSLMNMQSDIDGLDFDRMNELVSTFKIFEGSISGKDFLGNLQSGLYELEDQLINLNLAASQTAKKKSLENYLVTLRDSGRLTQVQFEGLSKALGDISSANFPKPDIDTLKEMNEFIQEQRSFIPRLKNGIDGWSKSTIGLEIAIDNVNKTFEAQEKIKSINKYRLELQNLHNQGKITSKDFETISKDLTKLSDTFVKKAKSPQTFFDRILIGAKSVSKPLRDIGSSVMDFGKTVIANMPSVAEGLVGKGEVSELGSHLDFLKTKMSLVMDSKQAGAFNNSLIRVMQTTGMTADQAGNLANTMNRFGVSVEDSTKLMPFLGNLVGKMGLDAGQAAEMGGQLTRTLGMSVDEAENLTKDFYEMGKARGFVDFLEDMPEITKDVTASFNKLGIVNSKVAENAIKSTGALTGMYRKLGIEQKTAVAASLKMQGALTDMSLDIQKLGVGLEPENFDAMIDVAGEITRITGKSADEAFKMIQDGAKDTNGFMLQMMDVAKNATNPKDIERLGLIMRKTFGDEAANLITNAELRNKATEENIEAVRKEAAQKKKGGDTLSEDQKILQGTFQVSQDLLKTNRELVKAMSEMKGKDAILQSWNTQLETWQDAQNAVNNETAIGKGIIAAYVQEAAGLSGVAYLAGMDKTAAALGKIGTNAQLATDAMKSLSGLFSGLQGFGSILGSLFLGLLPSIGKLFGSFLPIGGIVENVKTFSKGLSKLGVVGKVFGKVLGPIGVALGFIGDGIDAVQEKTAGKGIATALFGKSVKPDDMLKDAGTQALKWGSLGATIGSFIAPGIGTAIGGAIGAAVGAIGSFFKNAISNDWFTGMGDKISSVWDSVLNWIKGTWNNLWATIGDIGSYIKNSLKNAFNVLVDSGSKIGDSVYDGIKFAISKIADILPVLFPISSYIVGALKNAFTIAFDFVKGLWDKLPFSGITKFFSPTTQPKIPQKQIEKQKPAVQNQLEKVGGEVFDLKLEAGQAKNQYEGLKQKGTDFQKIDEAKANYENLNKKLSTKEDELKKLQIQPAVQQGAPNAAKNPTTAPTVSKEKGNTLDDVVKTLNAMKDSFTSEIKNINNRPVNVSLLGDIKKFLKVANAEGVNNIGQHASLVGG